MRVDVENMKIGLGCIAALLCAVSTACGSRANIPPRKPDTVAVQSAIRPETGARDNAEVQPSLLPSISELDANEKGAIEKAFEQLSKRRCDPKKGCDPSTALSGKNDMGDTLLFIDKTKLEKLKQAIVAAVIAWHHKWQKEKALVDSAAPLSPSTQTTCLRFHQFKKEMLLDSLVAIDLPRMFRVASIFKDLARQLPGCRSADQRGRFEVVEIEDFETEAYDDVLRQLANKEIRNTLDIEVNPRADRWSFSSALKKKKQRTLYLWNELVEAHIRCHSGSRLGCDLGEPTLASGNLDDIPNDFTLRALYLALLARSHSLSHPAYRQILQQGLAYLETTPAASETLSQAVIADIYLNAAEFYEHMYDYENANRYFQTAAGWMERSGAFSQPRIGSALISAGIALIRLEGIRLNPTPQDNLRNEEVSLLEKGWKYFEDVEALGDVNLNYYQTGVNVALYYMDIGAYEQSRHVLESLKQAATKRNESKGNIEGALCAIQIHLGQSILAQKDIDHFRDTARLEKKTRQISHQIETVAPTTTKGCFVFGLPKPQHPALALIEEVEDDIGATQRFFDTLIDVLIRIESYEAAQIHVEEKKRVYREIETISFKGFRNGIRHFTVDWAELYYQQGRIALKTGDFDTSLVYFQKAQKEYDTDAKWSTNEIAMLVYRQIANELKGNTAQAKILFRRAIAALKPSGKQNTWIDVPRLGSIAHLYAAYGRCEKVETLNNMRLSLCSDNTGCERLKREAELQLRECEVLRHRIDNSHHRITEAPPVR